MVYIVEINGVYGLTKGSSQQRLIKIQSLNMEPLILLNRFDICELGISWLFRFVARSFSGDPKQLVP